MHKAPSQKTVVKQKSISITDSDSDKMRRQKKAYAMWWENLFFLNECENALWTIDRLWDWWDAVGMCQASVNNKSWMKTHQWIDVPRYKTDENYQLEVCRRLRQEWTPFYWPERVNKKTGEMCYQERRYKLDLVINSINETK